MPRKCKGTTVKGQPCKRVPRKDEDYCDAHNSELPAELRFGSPQQARAAATGVKRKYPRLRETVEQKIEEKAERIVQAGIEALDATRLSISEDGEVHVHPDYGVRLRAHDTLLSRALGKPGQSMEIHSENRSITLSLDATDPDTRTALHEFLRGRPAAA
jgi:hypothetical protein